MQPEAGLVKRKAGAAENKEPQEFRANGARTIALRRQAVADPGEIAGAETGEDFRFGGIQRFEIGKPARMGDGRAGGPIIRLHTACFIPPPSPARPRGGSR